MKAQTDELVRRFLLGDLSKEERSEVEHRFLEDNEFFAQVLAAEDVLLDQYILSRLSEGDQEQAATLFESAPSQRQMVASARGLITLLQEAGAKKNQAASAAAKPTAVAESTNKFQAQEKTTATNRSTQIGSAVLPISMADRHSAGRFTSLAWVAIAIVGIILTAGIVYKHFQKESLEAQRIALEESGRKAREDLQTETQRSAELSKQLEIERQKRIANEALVAQLRSPDLTNPTTISLLPTTLERGGNSQIVRVRSVTRPIQLQLALDTANRYRRYSILITTFDGHRIWSADSLDSSQLKRRRLTVTLPSSILKPEDYKIALRALSENGDSVQVADYIFKIRK